MRYSARFTRQVAGWVGAVAVLALTLTVSGGSGAAGASSTEVLPSFPGGTPYVQRMPARVPNTSGIIGVAAYDTNGYPAPGHEDSGTVQHNHVRTAVKYAITPPIGGPHNGIWMNAGTYTKPIPNERAVHNLEHGAIWITYSPALPKIEVSILQSFVHRQSVLREGPGHGNRFIDLSPWTNDDLAAPIVISSWGYQLKVLSPIDPRLQQFVDKFRRNKTYSPESSAPVDGIAVATGGRPARDGTVIYAKQR